MPASSLGDFQERVTRAAEAVLRREGSVGPLELFQELQWVSASDVQCWRKGGEAHQTLEQWIHGGPAKFQRAIRGCNDWDQGRGLRAINAPYTRQSLEGTQTLQVTQSGDPEWGRFDPTHYVPSDLPARQSEWTATRLAKAPDLAGFEKVSGEGRCHECRAKLGQGSYVFMEKDQPLCMACADLDHLVILPAGASRRKRLPMKRGDDAWWGAEVPSAKAGAGYGFVLNGEGLFPDPRSPSQPEGVHGLPRLVDQNAFRWPDNNFQAPPLTSAIIYEWHLNALTPCQYFTDHPEPDLAKAVLEGRRKGFAAFDWKPEDMPGPQARATFVRSKLAWTELARDSHAAMPGWHRRLIQLRRTEPALRDDRLDGVNTRFDEVARWFAMARGPIRLAFNLAGAPQPIQLREGRHKVLLSSKTGIEVVKNEISLSPDAVTVLKSDWPGKGNSKT